MVKASIQIADEIVRLLGGERGLSRLKMYDITEHDKGLSAFIGRDPILAVVVITKTTNGFTLTVQSILPPISYSSKEVSANHLKLAIQRELRHQRKGIKR